MITELASLQRDYFVSDVIIRTSDGAIILYVPKDRVSEKIQKGFVSKTQLKNLAKKLAHKYSVESEIIYIKSAKLEEVSKGFETLLKAKFKDEIEDVSITFLTGQIANVWLTANEISNDKKKHIKEFLSSVFSPVNIDIASVQWISSEKELPSLVELLLTTKKIQPANLSCFRAELSKVYFQLDETWVNRQLDKLIKKKLIVRESETQEYALTGLGLMVIPNTLSRSNSDIVRALDLGRRKWSN